MNLQFFGKSEKGKRDNNEDVLVRIDSLEEVDMDN